MFGGLSKLPAQPVACLLLTSLLFLVLVGGGLALQLGNQMARPAAVLFFMAHLVLFLFGAGFVLLRLIEPSLVGPILWPLGCAVLVVVNLYLVPSHAAAPSLRTR